MIARFAMRGPLYAAATAAAFVLAALAFGLLLVPAGAVIALVTLRHGARMGAQAALTAAVLVVAVRLGLGQSWQPLLVLTALVFGPAWMLANGLRVSGAQAGPLLLAAMVVVVYAAGMRLAVGDVAAFWRELLVPLFALAKRDAGANFTDEQQTLIAGQVHLWSLVGMQCMFSGMLFLARWWQAALYNPCGFGAEFRELRLPRLLLGLALVLTVLDLLNNRGVPGLALAGDACVILVVLFALQGLAVIHHRARITAMASGWLVGMYVLLMLMPQVAGPLLATTGLADSAVDLRRSRPHQQP